MASFDRDYLLAAIVAFLAGIIVIVSLYLPWLAIANETSEQLNAFQVGEFTAESLNLAFASTAFNFLILFGCFMIFGAVLKLVKIEVGMHLIYAGALLSAIFTTLTMIISSFVAFLSPLAGGWICLCSSIAGLVSPKILIRQQKQEQPK
ncbi:MAG: hypothetical protein OEZ40_08280 [Candidatus Bathyarchaeota archaeon]|nr:hypothetical protein [Candidatus Bathyarchaeota archaeon]